MKKTKITNVISYFIIGILFFVLSQYSLFAGDDWSYSFNQSYGIPEINSFSDVIDSQIFAYQHWNGRFIVHCVVQCFAALLDERFFHIFNSIIFVFFCLGCNLFLDILIGKHKQYNLLLVLLLLFVLLPIQGNILLGTIAITVNYLWTSCIYIWLLIFIYKYKNKEKKLNSLLLCLVGLLSGALQESWSMGLSVSFFCYAIINRKKLCKKELIFFVSFWIGTFILVFAPGNLARLEFVNSTASHGIFFNLLKNFGAMCLDLRFVYLVIFVSLYLFFKERKTFNTIWNDYQLLYCFVFSNISLFIVAYSEVRQLYATELISSFIFLHILFLTKKELIISKKTHIIFSIVIVLISCYLIAYNVRKKIYVQYSQLVENVKTSEDGVVDASGYYNLCLKNQNYFYSKYGYLSTFASWSRRPMSKKISKTHDIHFITAILPVSKEQIIKNCIKTNKIKDYIYYMPNSNLYIVRIPSLINLHSLDLAVAQRHKTEVYKNIIFGIGEKYRIFYYHGVEELDYFVKDQYSYIILYYPDKFPIYNVDILYPKLPFES